MRLRDITMDDVPLYTRMVRDPGMMAELGGPLPPDGIEQKVKDIVRDVEAGRIWYFVILEDGADAGTVCVWDHEEDGQTITEIGWMVALEFQGRGLASAAVRSVLDRARSEGRWEQIHAYPAVTNGPSNAICRKNGFTLAGEKEIVYAGRTLRVNDWRLTINPSA